jgi:dienelactone hydrolase
MPRKEVDPLNDFDSYEFEHKGKRRTVFRIGEGPGVLVMHEIPGITPQVADFGRRLAAEGFRVDLPHLFGDPGRPLSGGYILGQLAQCCINSEFTALAKHRSSPIADWLRALAKQLHEECGGPGVGALGMCFTGGYALPLMMEPAVLAPVLSQPSCPFPVSAAHRCALAMSREELDNVKRRTVEGACVLGLRFTNDKTAPPERFETLRRELGEAFTGIEIDSSRGNAHGIKAHAHSVLTTDFVDREGHPTREAYDQVVSFFRKALAP